MSDINVQSNSVEQACETNMPFSATGLGTCSHAISGAGLLDSVLMNLTKAGREAAA